MKHLSMVLILTLLLCITSCGSNADNSTSNNSTSSSLNGQTNETDQSEHTDQVVPCDHSWIDANCTSPKTCSKCEEREGVALGHTTDSGVCSRCGENFSAWEMGEYTDEFNQPSGKKYIVVDSYGTFSNSATTNSKLLAAVQIDKDDVRIMLWEYGSHLVKGTFDYENYNVSILDENGTKHSFTGTIYKSGTRIRFDSDDENKIIALLRNNSTLKIYLKSTKYSISTYLFTINTNGFDAMYNSITGTAV